LADQVAHLLIDDDAYDLVDYGSVTDVTYDSTNKKLTQTAGGVTSDIVTVATLKTAMSLKKADVGLGNVDNKSSATIRGEITSANVTNALGYTPYNSTNPNGYTSNIGTVTGVKINGTTKSPTSGIVDIGTVITDVSTLAPKASPAFTGTPTAPTASSGTNTTQIATTAFVMDAFRANDAMVFKGTIGSSGATVTALPDTHYDGWTYKVITAGTYAGKVCEIGDMIICVKDGTSASNNDWTVVQTNIDGAVTGPASSTDGHVAVFSGTSGKVIKDGTYTIGKSVPSNAVFTDTDTKVTSSANHYSPATATGSDVSASATGATAAWNIDVVKGVTLNTDGKGHVTGMSVTSGKIPANPNTDTHRPIQVNGTQALGNNTTALNLIPGSNVSITDGGSGNVTIAATDTTYESKAAASGGTAVSLVTTGEKYTWNNKTSNTGTVTKVSTGAGLTGGDITTSGTVKANLTSETKLTNAAADGTETAGRVYPVRLDKNSKLAVNVPWENTTYESKAAASGGTDVSLVTTGEKATWNSKTSNTGTVTSVATGAGLTGGTITTSGTVKANLTSETKLTNAAADGTETAGRIYPVRLDKNSKLAVNVPWENTTYSSKTAASGGTEVSLVTTGEKYTWNSKTSNTGTVTSVATGAGLTGGTISTSGTIKANLTSETALTNAAADGTETAGRVYPVRLDKNSKLAVNVPWENTTYSSKAAASGGTDVSLVTTGEKYTWNSKVSCTEANVKNILGVDSTATTTTLFYRKDGTWQTPSGAGIGTVTQVNTGDGLTGGPITGSGTISLATSGVTEGSYGPSANVTGSDNATMNVPYITVDSYGRVTSIANKVYTSKNTTYSTATTSANGLMSSTDKTKLNGIAEGATANVGTITGITMNGSSKGTSGVVNLGTVITDVSGKADKSATVSTVSYDSTNKKITKTINGSTTDVVTVATLKTAMSLAKGDVGLGNVDNKSSATIRSEITKANVTNALGFTPPTTGAFTWGDLYMATST